MKYFFLILPISSLLGVISIWLDKNLKYQIIGPDQWWIDNSIVLLIVFVLQLFFIGIFFLPAETFRQKTLVFFSRITANIIAGPAHYLGYQIFKMENSGLDQIALLFDYSLKRIWSFAELEAVAMQKLCHSSIKELSQKEWSEIKNLILVSGQSMEILNVLMENWIFAKNNPKPMNFVQQLFANVGQQAIDDLNRLGSWIWNNPYILVGTAIGITAGFYLVLYCFYHDHKLYLDWGDRVNNAFIYNNKRIIDQEQKIKSLQKVVLFLKEYIENLKLNIENIIALANSNADISQRNNDALVDKVNEIRIATGSLVPRIENPILNLSRLEAGFLISIARRQVERFEAMIPPSPFLP